MAAIDCYNKALEKDFKRKVKYYLQKAAIAIVGEDSQTAGHAERVIYAGNILSGNVDVYEFALGVATNATIAAAINAEEEPSDSDIEFTVNSLINDYAGYDG